MGLKYPILKLFDERWRNCGNGHYWRGYAWLDGKLWDPSVLGKYDNIPKPESLNGCFCWICYDLENEFFKVFTGRAGSIPVFAGPEYITDRPDELDLEIETIWLEEEHWRYVEALPGTYANLYKNYFQVEPSLILESGHHFTNYPLLPFEGGKDGSAFEQMVLNTSRRLVEYAAGRKIVVMLSDGYDSRLILAALNCLGYDNLLAVTYGITGNGVVEKAAEIAKQLGVAWRFIDYSEPEHAEVMARDYPELVRLYASGTSVIQEQEVYACYRLSKELEKDCVLVPGISGDLQAGSYVPPFWFRWPPNRSKSSLKRWLLSRLTRYPMGNPAAQRWMDSVIIGGMPDNSEQSAVEATEKVVVSERVSKYICTTLRVYEFYNFDWYLPQWDADFLSFWVEQPVRNRRFRRKYREWCRTLFFEPAGIHFTGEEKRPRVYFSRLIKRFLPFGNRIAGGIPDPNRIAPMLEKLLGRKVAETEVNAELGQYLIDYYRK